ncbi:hypothetical protein M0802_010716 [Mischocyttarus mexicanus]|nr:hypothetical protein M0802_010716 [Mischocyttarus mexicanus]
MSLKYSESIDTSKLSFRNVDGKKLGLGEGCTSPNFKSYGVIKFILHNDEPVNVVSSISLVFLTLLLWITFDSIIPFLISTLSLILYIRNYLTSTNKDILLVVPSIGIHITKEKRFSGFNSYTFLPWDTIEDLFINEVIIRKMPGVHIHKISELNWFEQQEQSKLTVPGSYWLCHKNQIYKFTLMFHHTMRDLQGFSYGKELMKVIRRIIKSEPSQGQQFITKHILVTYNYSSWTRQDKMFATLKFANHKEATTVSRAIILTIKIIQDDTCELEIFQKDKSNHLESECIIERRNSNIYRLKINATDTNNHRSNLNLNESSSNSTSSIVKCQDKDLSNVSTSEFMNIEKNDVNKINNRSITFTKDKKENNELYNNIENPVSLLNLIECEELIEHKETELQLNSNAITQGNNTINSNDEGIIDSTNLPYQYLIEKEIENAKKNIIECSFSNNNKSITVDEESRIDSTTKSENKYVKKITKDKVPETAQNNNKQSIKDLSVNSKKLLINNEKTIKDNNKLKRIGESEKKVEDSIVKSSNITDLIMKGRMFMIKQDQDSVSVVEQNTKSDLDEVLENSEKFETKRGEKCLLNSSLLKLENLITKIKIPKETVKSNYENKCTSNNINSNVDLDSMVIKKDSANNQCMDTQINVNNPSVSTFNLQDIPTSSKLCLEYKEEHESNLKNFESKENNVSSKIQFWDDNDESENIFKETFKNIEKFNVSNCSIVESVIDDSESHINSNNSEDIENTNLNITSKVPRIISDQIVTIDQIPLGLQKIVKERLSKRNRSSINNESNLQDTSLDDTILISPNESTNLEMKSFKTDLLDIEKCLTPLPDDTEMDSDDTSIICSNIAVVKETELPMVNDKTIQSPKRKVYSSTNKKRKHKREKKDYKHDTKISSTDLTNVQNSNSLNNKLQDITEDFYQDLMQHRKHGNNNCNEKFLNHEKKSLENDVKNNDTRIEMLKFIEDITRGVKVVVKRMNIKTMSTIIGNNSSLAYVN